MSSIQLSINGKEYTVGSEEVGTTRLVKFIRETAGLTGTHVTCEQGGCGVCTVVATVPDPASGGTKTFSINSCLASLYNCDGWSITTIEGLGNEIDGYNLIQQRLADNAGSQCGYCSPGMVMNMYGLTESKSTWTEDEVERNLDGHICRCTGYRPILEAFKNITPADIEDAAGTCKKRAGAGGCCKGKAGKSGKGGCCKQAEPRKKKEVTADGTTFFYPTTMQEVTSTLGALPDDSKYQIMFGNTGVGITGDIEHDAVISLRGVTELTSVTTTTTVLTAGAAVSISTLLTAFEQAKSQKGFEYLAQLIEHWNKVGSISIRNLGCWAGNLSLRSQISTFPSDLFITLVGCGAEVLLGSTDGTQTWVLVETLVGRDLVSSRDIILQLRLRPLDSDAHYQNYKVMPRSSTALALINASFNMKVSSAYSVVSRPILAYGGINGTFVRATNTEKYLGAGSNLLDVTVLQGAFAALETDIVPDNDPLNPTPQYRIDVAKGFLYKFIMSVISGSDSVDAGLLSGADTLSRPTSVAQHTFDENEETWPLGKAMPKIESYIQCGGEAKFAADEIKHPGELIGRFLQSTQANAAIVSVDTTAALAVPGIVGFVSAEDIPGVNDMQPFDDTVDEPVFASGRVQYHGQAIGVLVGTTDEAVKKALALIDVTYADVKRPVLTITEAMVTGMVADQPEPYIVGDVAVGFENSTQVFEGEFFRGSQYHFHMECQATKVSLDGEGSYNVIATTQWAAATQAAIAQVLAIGTNRVNVTVKRVGGGFGAKIDACNLVHTAAALAAYKFQKPISVTTDLPTNMTLIGWRDAFRLMYKIGINDAGLLQAVQCTLVGDTGFVNMDSAAPVSASAVPSCYNCANWEVTPLIVTTDTASNTWCRCPSTIEAITLMETAMEHVARGIGMDPLEFRKLNLIPDGGVRIADTLPPKLRQLIKKNKITSKNTGLTTVKIPRNLIGDMISQIESEADVENRKAEIEQFNLENRWRKRGLAVMPMLWPYEVPSVYGFGVFISIYASDGTVAICPGGTEMGQGLNTKVAQVAAFTLGCDLDQIRIKPVNTLTGANSDVTGGSHGSDINTYCTQQAALALRARLDAVGGKTWKETVSKANLQGVALSEYYWNGPDEVKAYSVFAVSCTEVELDVLTGNFLVLRADIIEDAGKSSSPLVDVGQVEGGFVFGQGLFTTEGPIFDPTTGAKLNFDTWHYKPLLGRDIAADLRVTLLSNAPNPDGVVGSKVTNEPPTCMGFSVPLALRQAVTSARLDAGTTGWFQMDTPLTVDHLQELCLVSPDQFTFVKADRKY